jgi:molybdopterin-binding protein
VIDLPPKNGRHITSIVPADAVAALGLKVGSPTAAVFQASSLVLVALGP